MPHFWGIRMLYAFNINSESQTSNPPLSTRSFFTPPPQVGYTPQKDNEEGYRVCFPLVSIGKKHIATNAASINAPDT